MLVTTPKGKVKIILTKACNVTQNLDPVNPGKQALLQDMYKNPELVEDIYIDNMKFYVLFGGSDAIEIGELHDKYTGIAKEHRLKVRQWKVTGGKPLDEQKYYGVTKHGYFGLNLEIDVI